MKDESGPGGDRARPSASRSSRLPNRVTLEFAGPPLALPREGAAPDPEPLQLDTTELDAEQAARSASDDGSLAPARVAEDRGSEKLRLDLDELDAEAARTEGSGGSPDTAAPEDPSADGWGRLSRGSSRPPARPRSVTPPPLARDVLDLVTRRSRPPSAPGLDLASEMADRYALGDYTGALRVAELLLGRDPEDVRAKRCAASSRERLLALYTARLGAVSGATAGEVGRRVPEVVVPEHEIRWLGLDHRQGFVLSRLDGAATVDELVDVSGMSRLELLRTLVELVEAGAIRV